MTTTTARSGASDPLAVAERTMSLGTTTPSDRRTDLTPLDVAKKALELAEAHPEKVGDCTYLTYDMDDNVLGGCCIFGHALLDLGVPAETLTRYESTGISALLLRLRGDDREAGVDDLTWVQWAQDEGRPWGDPEIRDRLVSYIEDHS